ncbi:minor extracellular protease Epr [Evansella caseinilytica]|uniref:Minor extracellular protease Epr n=1 Tax=Evansella caseinilytica TaxID=1503961 RepID=A0A1H3IK04_9BACI|nr:hypothetical protein [Evansella caseinilytica]SDY28002.1 minor extracellular protease Epr [Evansella caseinilytica]
MKQSGYQAVILCICLTLLFSLFLPRALEASAAKDKRVIVVFDKHIDKKPLREVKGELHVEFQHIPAVSVTIPPQTIRGLERNPNIMLVEKDQLVTVKNQVIDWGITKTVAANAWQSGLTGKGVRIAVIDTR